MSFTGCADVATAKSVTAVTAVVKPLGTMLWLPSIDPGNEYVANAIGCALNIPAAIGCASTYNTLAAMLLVGLEGGLWCGFWREGWLFARAAFRARRASRELSIGCRCRRLPWLPLGVAVCGLGNLSVVAMSKR